MGARVRRTSKVLVIDDGSDDDTAAIVVPFAEDPRVRLISREERCGKASGLNLGLPELSSDFVLLLDADGAPAPGRAALAGSARRAVEARPAGHRQPAVWPTTRTLLCRMQAVEFSATVSVLRRAQTDLGAADDLQRDLHAGAPRGTG